MHYQYRLQGAGKSTCREDQGVPDDNDDIARNRESTQAELGPSEQMWGRRETKEANKTIGGDGGNRAGRNQRGECNLTREDGAEQECGEDKHHSNSIPGLAIACHLPDPFGTRKDSVASYSEDES